MSATGSQEKAPKPLTFLGNEDCQEGYNETVSDLRYHHLMLMDTPRLQRYREALFAPGVIKGKVVADIGTGSGIMALWAAKAGAKKVYAIEQSSMHAMARENVKANNLQDVVEVIHGRAEEVEMPEKVDVIVSEWMGNMLITEGVLPFVTQFRDKWLKAGGLMLPEKGVMYIAPCDDTHYLGRMSRLWESFPANYGLNMDPMIIPSRKSLALKPLVKCIKPEGIKASPAMWCEVDFRSCTVDEGNNLRGPFEFTFTHNVNLNCLFGWFDVTFPNAAPLSTGPYTDVSTWRATQMFFDKDYSVKKGDKMTGIFKVSSCKEHYGLADIEYSFRINGGPEVRWANTLDYESAGGLNPVIFDCPI